MKQSCVSSKIKPVCIQAAYPIRILHRTHPTAIKCFKRFVGGYPEKDMRASAIRSLKRQSTRERLNHEEDGENPGNLYDAGYLGNIVIF